MCHLRGYAVYHSLSKNFIARCIHPDGEIDKVEEKEEVVLQTYPVVCGPPAGKVQNTSHHVQMHYRFCS